MATHSSILAWRIPGTEEPNGLLSMGSHRVGHDWSDLASALACINKHTKLEPYNMYYYLFILPLILFWLLFIDSPLWAIVKLASDLSFSLTFLHNILHGVIHFYSQLILIKQSQVYSFFHRYSLVSSHFWSFSHVYIGRKHKHYSQCLSNLLDSWSSFFNKLFR